MTNWDVHTIGGIAAGLKGWAGLNKTEAKHVIYCIIESIQDDTREWILQLLFFFVKPNKSLSVTQLYFYSESFQFCNKSFKTETKFDSMGLTCNHCMTIMHSLASNLTI